MSYSEILNSLSTPYNIQQNPSNIKQIKPINSFYNNKKIQLNFNCSSIIQNIYLQDSKNIFIQSICSILLKQKQKQKNKLKLYNLHRSQDRQKYLEIYLWLVEKLRFFQKYQNVQQLNIIQIITEEKKILVSGFLEIIQLCTKQCHQKGQILHLLMNISLQLINTLVKQIQQTSTKHFIAQIKAFQSLQNQFHKKVSHIQQQNIELLAQKNHKWKNMYMLIKDNRILRKQKNKLMKMFRASQLNLKITNQELIKLKQEIEKQKLMEQDSLKTAEEKIMDYINTKVQIQEINKKLKVYPQKVRQIMMNQLKNVQIYQLNTLYEKLAYIQKAIENSGEMIDENQQTNDYFDSNKVKMYYNISTQTDFQVNHVAVNTIQKKSYNHSSQVMLADWRKNLKIQKNIYNQKIKKFSEIKITKKKSSDLSDKNKKYQDKILQFTINNILTINYPDDFDLTQFHAYNKQIDMKIKGFQNRRNSIIINNTLKEKRMSRVQNFQFIRPLLQQNQRRNHNQQNWKIMNMFNLSMFEGNVTADFQDLCSKKIKKYNVRVSNFMNPTLTSQIKNTRFSQQQYSQISSQQKIKAMNLSVNNQNIDPSINRLAPTKASLTNRDSKHSLNRKKQLRNQQGNQQKIQPTSRIFTTNSTQFNKQVKTPSSSMSRFSKINLNSIKAKKTIKTIISEHNQPNIDEIKQKNHLKKRSTQILTNNNGNKINTHHRTKTDFNTIMMDQKDKDDKINQSYQNKKNYKSNKSLKSFKSTPYQNHNLQNDLITNFSPHKGIDVQTIQDIQHSEIMNIQQQHPVSVNFDLMKHIQKIIKSIAQRSKQILKKSYNFKQFLCSFYQQQYGGVNNTKLCLQMLKQIKNNKNIHTPTINCLNLLMNQYSPEIYKQDLFKIFTVIIDKNGGTIGKSPGGHEYYKKNIKQVLQIYINQKQVQKILNQLYLTDLNGSIADYFIAGQRELRRLALQTQLYRFISSQLLLPSQNLVSFQLLKQLTYFFSSNSLSVKSKLLQLKLFTYPSIQLHRLSLICSKIKFRQLELIQQTIQSSYIKQIYPQNNTISTQVQQIALLAKEKFRMFPLLKQCLNRHIQGFYKYNIPIPRMFMKLCRVNINEAKLWVQFPIADTLNFMNQQFQKVQKITYIQKINQINKDKLRENMLKTFK